MAIKDPPTINPSVPRFLYFFKAKFKDGPG